MRRFISFLLAVVCLHAGSLLAQTQPARPDCQITFVFTAAGTSAPIDNGTSNPGQGGCTTWTMVYKSTGFSAVSIRLSYADDSSGSPGSYSAWSDLFSGSLPLTSTSGASISGYGFKAWVAAEALSVTGSGRITGQIMGWRPGAGGPSNGAISINDATPILVTPANTSGTEIGTNANPFRVNPTGTTAQPATIANGADTVTGSTTDAASTATDSTAATVMQVLKQLSKYAGTTGVKSIPYDSNGIPFLTTDTPSTLPNCLIDTTEPSAGADAASKREFCDSVGRKVFVPFAVPALWFDSGVKTQTTTTGVELVAADATYKLCITSVTWDNTDAAAVTHFQILEGGDIGTGTALLQLGAIINGSGTYSPPTPVCTSAVNKSLNADSAAGSTSTFVTVHGFKRIN